MQPAGCLAVAVLLAFFEQAQHLDAQPTVGFVEAKEHFEERVGLPIDATRLGIDARLWSPAGCFVQEFAKRHVQRIGNTPRAANRGLLQISLNPREIVRCPSSPGQATAAQRAGLVCRLTMTATLHRSVSKENVGPLN